MNRIILACVVLLYLSAEIYSQEKYWVYLTDKNGVEFNPYEYFSDKAINRRMKHNLPLVDSSDFPINENYLNAVSKLGAEITGHSRWFNAIACEINSEVLLSELKKLPFVDRVEPMLTEAVITEVTQKLHYGELSLIENQIKSMEGELFKADNITGKGITICIIDAGFPEVNTDEMFSHINDRENGIVGTKDFKSGKSEVYKFDSHGASVLSNIGGIIQDSIWLGLAPDANFLLARTERIMVEGKKEEEDWLMAVEWADKMGADIINSSLGYTSSRYFKENMDGKTAIITRAGNMAASKGILVVNSAGNDGASNWKYIGAPADADSVLTVGGVNPWTGLHTSFSSYGPTADGRLKPNVTAYGHTMAFKKGGYVREVQGTSFSSPLVAGFAACVMQLHPEMKVMDVFKAIEMSGDLYPYYDYAHGYGIPQASYFLKENEDSIEDRFKLIDEYTTVKIIIDSAVLTITDKVHLNYHNTVSEYDDFHVHDNYMSNDSHVLLNKPKLLYVHLKDKSGKLKEYKVIEPYQYEAYVQNKENMEGYTLGVWYDGQYKELEIK